jgi:hypothetical protein
MPKREVTDMSALPFALAALLLMWASMAGVELLGVWLLALYIPFVAAFVLGCLWRFIGPHKCKSRRARWVNGVLVAMSVAVFVSVPTTNWPLRLAFRLSKPSLEAVAQSLRAGKTFPQPMRVGLFTIQKAEIYDLNDKVCLWTDLNWSGKVGFTRCAPGDLPFNLASNLTLDETWQFIAED